MNGEECPMIGEGGDPDNPDDPDMMGTMSLKSASKVNVALGSRINDEKEAFFDFEAESKDIIEGKTTATENDERLDQNSVSSDNAGTPDIETFAPEIVVVVVEEDTSGAAVDKQVLLEESAPFEVEEIVPESEGTVFLSVEEPAQEEIDQDEKITKVTIHSEKTDFAIDIANPDTAEMLVITGTVEGPQGEYIWQMSTDQEIWNQVWTEGNNPTQYQIRSSNIVGDVFYRLVVNGTISNTIMVRAEWFTSDLGSEEEQSVMVEEEPQRALTVNEPPITEDEQSEQFEKEPIQLVIVDEKDVQLQATDSSDDSGDDGQQGTVEEILEPMVEDQSTIVEKTEIVEDYISRDEVSSETVVPMAEEKNELIIEVTEEQSPIDEETEIIEESIIGEEFSSLCF